MVTVMTMTVETAKEMAAENRKMVETILVGRESLPTSNGQQPFSMEQPNLYDPESTPLSPGIEAVMYRESEEERLEVLQRERAVLQERMRELQEEENLQGRRESEDSSREPWSTEVL